MADRHGRRSIRLPGFDYTEPGAYFVTICTHMRQDLLGVVTHGDVLLTEAGRIAARCWAHIPSFFTEITLDVWVVMPNHLHGIVVIGTRRGEALDDLGTPARKVSTLSTSPLHAPPRGTTRGSLAATIQNYKSVAARQINVRRATPGAPVWQRNYFEHILRDENDLQRVRKYVLGNPFAWRPDLDPKRRLLLKQTGTTQASSL